MLKKKYSAGIIGLGVGLRHLEVYSNHPSISFIKACDFDNSKFEDLKKLYEDVDFSQHSDDILNDPSIDIVSIASYDNYHHDHVITALNAKKNVFVEKPLCINEKELINICNTLKKNPDLKITSNFVLRCNPYFQHYKKLIDNNDIGEIYHIEGEYNYGRLNKLTQGWRGDIKDYSVSHGGGVHIIDLLMWLTNEKIKECVSFANNFSTKNSKFQGNDNVVSILKFNNGITSKISSNFSSVTPHHHTLSIYGTKGTIIHTHENSVWYKARDNKNKQIIQITLNNAYKENMLKNFLEHIVFDKNLLTSFEEITNCMAVSIAIEKSIYSHKIEKVKYINV